MTKEQLSHPHLYCVLRWVVVSSMLWAFGIGSTTGSAQQLPPPPPKPRITVPLDSV